MKKKDLIFLVISFPLRSLDWPGPSFRRNLWCQKFLPRFLFIWKRKKNCYYYFSKLQGFSWCLGIENKNAIIFFFRLSCPEDGIIDRISRSSGGRVQHTLTHRALNAESKQHKKLEKHESRKREKKGGVECTGRGDVRSYLFFFCSSSKDSVCCSTCIIAVTHTHTHANETERKNWNAEEEELVDALVPTPFFRSLLSIWMSRLSWQTISHFLVLDAARKCFYLIEMEEIGRLQCHSNLSNEELIPIVLQGLNFISWNTHYQIVWIGARFSYTKGVFLTVVC